MPGKSSTGSAEEAKQGAETLDDRRAWAWVEAEVWTERMLSALGNGVKGGKWYSLIDKVYAPATLALAWTKVQANEGAAGVDGQSVDRFAAKADVYLSELSTALRADSYRPQPVKRVEIPKGDGRTRPLGIPTVKDRIVQQAVRLVIEPIFESGFCDGSYGFRPERGCRDALREVDRLLKEGYAHVVDADLQSYFDTIPHERLMARVEGQVSDGRILDLLRGWLKADILRGLDKWTPVAGSPQGAVISPLLANIYLDPLDRLMAEHGYPMVRYADDFVILTRSQAEAEAALALVRAWVGSNGLTLHPEKTRIANCRKMGNGFEFLGYRFERGRRHVRKKSLDKLKETIRAKTRRTRGQSLKVVVVDLNRTLKGWFGYFKHAHPSIFMELDQMIRRRLRAMLRKQERRPGVGNDRADHQRWPNAYFANARLFALHTAWQSARQSR
ncbi:MAG TPA: group II intron reverse transcriptase/maturase [Dongiaceae bacterium]|jgi:RNA-directed DNA polymerase|nr:group II intron reverse transcriptase/maturase [Dongiaceae bacterium]